MNNENQQNIKNKIETCNHNHRDAANTLIGVPKLKMVTPARYTLRCKQCGEVFSVGREEIPNIKEFLCTFF